ncbi:MAG: GtrA family protein [Pseudomonadota bacterium]
MDESMADVRPFKLNQMLSFALVGGVTALTYAGGYMVLREVGVSAVLAATLSYLAAITLQYFGHSGITFRKNPRDRGQLLRFLVLNGAGLATAVAITLVLTQYFGAEDWMASVAVILVLPVMNWVVMRLWVFV